MVARRATILSVNVSLPREIEYEGRIVRTGIFKQAVEGRVQLRTRNLDGDGQADLVAHGGIHKAVYAYPFEHYGYWQRALDREDFEYGQFGENLTTEGLIEDEVCIGDVFRVGSATIEVTQPRVPCAKLGIKMGMREFLKPFLQSCRVGFYLRVVKEGEIGAGDTFERIERDAVRMTVRDICHLLYMDRGNIEDAERALELRALSPGWREAFVERLERGGEPTATEEA